MANTDNIGDYFEYLNKLLPVVQALITDEDFYPTWQVSVMDGSGSWIWEREGSRVWAYATPWWEDGSIEEIPVMLCTEDHDDGVYADHITFARPTGNVDEDARRYLTTMQVWLTGVTGV